MDLVFKYELRWDSAFLYLRQAGKNSVNSLNTPQSKNSLRKLEPASSNLKRQNIGQGGFKLLVLLVNAYFNGFSIETNA